MIELRQWLREMADSGSTLLVTSHNLDFLKKLCDSIMLLRCGKQPVSFNPVSQIDLEALFVEENSASTEEPPS
jgi:ABC-type multidrug transport system ATPase subunit